MDRISVIVPVYNVEAYLNACVKSIVKQTHKDLEIILIDDGSTDGSGALCDCWQKKDSRIRVLHIENHGVSHARNVGLDMATGDYIGFVDSDDWIGADMYEKMIADMRAQATDVCCGGYVKESAVAQELTLRKGASCVLTSTDALCEMFSLKKCKLFWWELCDKLFKAELFCGVRLDEDIPVHEDMLVMWRIMRKASSVSYLPLWQYHYRMRATSATHEENPDNRRASLEAHKRLWEQLADLQSSSLKTTIHNHYLAAVIGMLKTMLNHSQVDDTFMENLHWLRKHKWDVWLSFSIPLKKKIGMLFFCLPLSICKKIGQIIFSAGITKGIIA